MLVKPHDAETLCITCSKEGVFLNGVSNFLKTVLTLVSVSAGMSPGLNPKTTENEVMFCGIHADPFAVCLLSLCPLAGP